MAEPTSGDRDAPTSRRPPDPAETTPDSAGTATANVEPVKILAAPDYLLASAQFFREAVDARMTEIEPSYGAMRRVSLPEGVSGIRVQVDDVETISPTVAMSHEIEVLREDVKAGRFDVYHRIIDDVAQAHLNSMMAEFYKHVGEAAAAVGNEVNIGGPLTVDIYLDILERLPWRLTAAGELQQPQIHLNPKDAAELRSTPLTPAQQQRLQAIAEAKLEEHVSRRRSRRLRRKPD